MSEGSFLEIPVTKAGAVVTINTDSIPQAVYVEALRLGLKEMVNRNMSKITTKGLEGEDLDKARAAALAKANENVEAINNGTIRIGSGRGTAKSKESGAVMTEARRIARNIVKDELKKAGQKISHYAASDITKAANALIEADPSIIETAKANLEARTAKPVAVDVTSLIKEDSKLVAKAAEKKAAAKETLSKTQAGIVAKRKPSAAASATAH